LQAKTQIEQRVLDLIEPVADEMSLAIVRVRMLGREKNNILQIMAERPADGMLGIGECARLSRSISALIDVEDPVAGKYALEVSSPGIDRPLTQPVHFSTWSGFDIRLELEKQTEGQRRFKGRLLGFEDDTVLIVLADETETSKIPYASIHDAKLTTSDFNMEKSAALRKAAKEKQEKTHEH